MGEEKSWKLDKTLKIDDDQLKTPEHDKICLWLHKMRENFIIKHYPNDILYPHITQFISSCKFYNNSYYKRENECCDKKHYCVFADKHFTKVEKNKYKECKNFEEIKEDYNNLKHFLEDSDKYSILFEWEKPIKTYNINGNGFVIGIPDFTLTYILNDEFETEYVESINKIFRSKREPDAAFNNNFNNKRVKNIHKVIFEVKPKIKSLGETLRQLQLYKSYEPKAIFYIVSKSIENKDIFEQQGFNFIAVTDEMLDGIDKQ